MTTDDTTLDELLGAYALDAVEPAESFESVDGRRGRGLPPPDDASDEGEEAEVETESGVDCSRRASCDGSRLRRHVSRKDPVRPWDLG